MRQALTWYVYGFLLLAWAITSAREFNLISPSAYPLPYVAGLSVLGAIPFFVLALAVALWPRREATARPDDESQALAAD